MLRVLASHRGVTLRRKSHSLLGIKLGQSGGVVLWSQSRGLGVKTEGNQSTAVFFDVRCVEHRSALSQS